MAQKNSLGSSGVRPMSSPHITHDGAAATSRTSWRFKYEERRKKPPREEDVKLPLTFKNYKRKFHALLYYEEEEHMRLLEDRCNGEYELTLYTRDHEPKWLYDKSYSRYGFLVGMKGDQVMYATQASGIVFLVDHGKDICAAEILGENYKAISEKFYLGFQVREADKLERHYRLRSERRTLKVHIEFEVKHFYFDLLHESLNNLGNEILAKILPSDEDFQRRIVLQRIPYPEYRMLMLDKEYQFRALQMMMFNDSNAPLLIPGPFGTGKTRLLAVGTYNFIEYGRQCCPPQAVRVLVCCHHQISADTFLDRYFEVMKDWDTVVIRVTRANYTKSKYANCYLPVGQFKRNVREIIGNKYLVVVTTFLTAHNIQSVIGNNVFTHILIDEGAQTREPETIAPLSMANRHTKIIIAGDDQQVGPQLLVLGDIPQAHGLCKSLLERLLEHYKGLSGTAINQFSAPLRRNYRCTREILELPSKLFYQSQLIPAARGVFPHPNAPYPLIFVCSSIQKVTSHIEGDTSAIEAQLLISKLVEFLHEWPHREWKRRRLEDVCVMAVSRRQISVLKNILRENHRWLKRIQLFPTYAIQGHEFRALFISTVECVDSSGKTVNPTKSLCNPYVFNTAITRARSLVVAVGNPFTLLSVEANVAKPKHCWREFITHCLERHSFIIPDSVCDRSRDIPAEVQRILVTQAVPACLNKELLPVEDSCTRSRTKLQPQQNDVKSVKPQKTAPTQVEREGSSLIPRANQTKPTSTKQLGQQTKPAPMQLSSPQQPKLQPSPSISNRSSVPQKPAAKLHPKPKQPQVNQQDHLNTTLQQNSQRSQSQESQHKVSTTSPVVTRNSTRLQPKVSSQYNCDFPTLQEAAKVPIRKKQHCDPSAEKNSSLLHSQSSYHFRTHHNHCAVDMELLKSPLTRENYRAKFHQLLCREEEEHERLLAERCNGIYELTIYQPGLEPPELSYEYEHYHKYEECLRYGYITADHLDGDKLAYAKHTSEGYMYIFFPVSNESHIRADIVEGYFPKKKGPDVLFVSFNETELVRLFPAAKKQQCTVRNVRVVFELKYSYFYRQHDTLDKISDEVIAKILPLCGKEFTHQNNFTEDYCPSGRYRNTADLDHYQFIALKAIMMCDTKAPLLIVGSFGTGKTRLLARAAMQIVQENRRARVLVCAHHQSTADSYVVNYFSKVFQTNEMVRLMNPRYNPPPKFKNYYQTAKCKILRSSAHNVCVIVTTLATSLHLHSVLKPGHFTHILMDEGAQSREPAAVAPLTFANRDTKLIIAGDHKQVGPAILVLGNEAQMYGLKVSLLERLHQQYKRIPHAETHCATLLNNYRCHKVLLSLPSYLFYNSALVTKAEKDAQLHPIDKTPLHFICSDLDDSTTEVVSSNNHKELKMLLDKAVKYTSPWPEEWGPKDLSTICIMTATGNQKSQALSMVRSLYPGNKKRERFEVLPAYDIQGREFRAVFLSTAEPTTPEGKTKNPTKSPCSQYVFNTAITRSKSLVVCAGNPFLLMKMEQHMDNECLFWKDYVRRCIESKTLYVPNSSSMPPERLEACLQKLQHAVFSTASSTNLEHVQQGTDTILSAYSKVFDQIPQCKKCTIQLKAIGSNSLWEITHEAEGNEQVPSASRSASPSSSAYKCELVIKSPRVAEAYPIDPSQSVVTINGLKNRHGAFDGDIVWVEVAKSIDKGKCIGKVVGIDQQCHQLKYVCKVDRHSAIHFNPIDKKSPRLVNLPKLSRGLIQNYKKEQIDSVMDKQAQQDYIVVFDEQSLPAGENLQLPKIKELIAADSAEHLLFIVKVLGWLPKYRLPLGAVVDACPRGTSYFHAERLLRVAHNISVTDPDVPSEDDMEVPVNVEQDDTEFYQSAITIDPSDAKCLDDALSLTHIDESTYKVAVLIVNIAKFLKANSHISKEAEKRGTSVYGSREQSLMHMLPPSISSKLSLSFGDTRSVVCVSARVVWENGSISSVSDVDVFEAKMCSKARLTYKQAQEILENNLTPEVQNVVKHFNSYSSQLNLNKTLLKLYEIAMHLRIKRINDAAYSYEISEAGEEKNWQAHLLVEELMIWANKSVASFVYQHLPENTLLRQQVAPPHDTVAAFKGSFSSIGGYSLAMKHLNFRSPVEPLLVLKSTAKNIMDAISSDNTQQLLWLLTCDNLYPQLAAAKIQKALMGRRAEYVCTTKHEASASEIEAGLSHYPPYWHDTLRLSHYTHFTSPLRRYADVVVHRLLHTIFNGSSPDYSKEELSKLCQHLNLRSRAAREFQSMMDKLEQAIEFGDSCGETQAIIIKGEKGTYGMCFTDISFKPLHSKDMKIHQSSLTSSRDADYSDILRWQVKIVSVKSQEFLLTHPQLCQFSVKQEKTCEDSVLVKVLHKNEELSKQKAQGVLSDALVVSQFTAPIVTEVVSIPPEACQQIHDFIKNPIKANMLTVSKYYEPMPCSTATNTPEGIASKIAQSPVVICDVQKSFKTGSVVKVWLGRSIRQPIMTPCLQLVEVAPEISICVEHNQHPAECFSDTNLCQATRAKYQSIEHYINLWEKVLLAEAAHGSVNSSELVLVRDVLLQWPKLVIPTNCTDNIHYIPNGDVTMEVPSQNMMEYIDIEEGDLVCARYKLPTLRSVYHMVINRIELDESKTDDKEKLVRIYMKPIGTEACHVSKKMHKVLQQNPACEIQVINLQPSFRRIYQGLSRLLKKDPTSLVYKVALGQIEVQKLNSGISVEQIDSALQTDNAHRLWDIRTELNEMQRRSIELGIRRRLQLIQGPPGTGKSVTGAHLAYIFAKLNGRLKRGAKGKCVVYCGPSNKAVDVVHDKLQMANKKRNLGLKLLRLYGRAHERKDFPGPCGSHGDGILPNLNVERRCEERFLDDALHKKVRSISSLVKKMDEEFKLLHEKKLSPSPRVLKEYKDLIETTEKKVMADHYDIILCTCNETASRRMLQLAKKDRIAQCIVDESGMSHEPETITAISLCNHVVLIGDHKQLQPVIRYPPAKESGMSTSLFERYAGHFPNLLITLDTQYRMHEAICQFPSLYFYDGCLKADESLKDRQIPGRSMEWFWPRGDRLPIVFCNVVGREEESSGVEIDKKKVDPHSKHNKQEAEKVMEVVTVLHERHGVDYREMAVITPYSAQKNLIRELKAEKQAKATGSATSSARRDPADTKLEELAIVSITESQGDEYGYVILSTVRSQAVEVIRNHDLVQPDRSWLREHLGFLTDPHEINVGITRAKYGLIIIGNRWLLEYDETWKALLGHYNKKRCIVEGKEFPKA